jgi:hypothetical protein
MGLHLSQQEMVVNTHHSRAAAGKHSRAPDGKQRLGPVPLHTVLSDAFCGFIGNIENVFPIHQICRLPETDCTFLIANHHDGDVAFAQSVIEDTST